MATVPHSTGGGQVEDLDQTNRDGRLDTPLGKDKLALKRFQGIEGISDLFEFRIDALSKDENIDFDKLLGKNCCVTVNSYNGVKRHFNGVLTEAQWLGNERRYFLYRLTLRPWLWLLGHKANCRIFKDKNALAIIKEIFDDAGFKDYESKVNEGDLEKFEYCVQYRETDLAFVSRLMEEAGIYTFYEHSSDKHKLILANQRSSHVKVTPGTPRQAMGFESVVQAVSNMLPQLPQIPGAGDESDFVFIRRDQRSGLEREHIYDWRSERRFRTGKFSLNDFDYMKPSANLKVDQQGTENYAHAKQEAYDYPGRYVKPDVGKRLAKVRLEAQQAADRLKYAAGHAVSLYPGCLFEFKQHPTDSGRYLVVQATHTFQQQAYDSAPAPSSDEPYQGSYVVMKNDRQYRAPLVTPRPVVRGPQTAIVAGEKDDKSKWIDVDKEGRILVQFHWNRDEKNEKLTSRRVRVAQMWSGKSWGWQVIPRVGQEVVVDFLEGDPDQPLVVGTVYNAEYQYPYPLPDNMTISGVKTECAKKDGTGYNELIFEDKDGAENIRMHAQRFHEVTVREKETRTIGVAQKDSEVARETVIEHGHDNLTLKHGDRTTLLKMGDDNLKLQMGDQNVKLELGDQTVDVAKQITITGHLGIKLVCGQSSIEMTPFSITIKSLMIDVKGDAMTTVQGSAMLTLKGGITMIN